MSKRPEVESVDYDTCQVYLPTSDKHITFRLDNITDKFLESGRTSEDAKRYGVIVMAEWPNTRLLEEVGEEEEGSNDSGGRFAHTAQEFAEIYEVTPREFKLAFNLARETLLDSFQKRISGNQTMH